MQGKVVVILLSGNTARAPVYRHLVDMGATLVLVHPVTPIPEFDGIFQYHLLADTDDVDTLEPVLLQYLEDHKLTLDAIISFDEYAVYSAVVLAQRLGCRPVPLPPEKMQRTNVKSLFRKECRKIGLASPAMAILTRPETGLVNFQTHIQRVIDEAGLTFPIVMKPSPGAGSLLAKLCYSVEEICEHALFMWDFLATCSAVKHLSLLLKESSLNEIQILMEEYVGGRELDLDCCIENGKIVFCSISDNWDVRPPFFLEEGGLCPTTLPIQEQREVLQLLEQYVSFHGEDLHGVLHFEAKYDFERRKAFLIEVNCRLGGAETNAMIRTCYRGLQLGESLVRCALGLSVAEQLSRHYPEVLLDRGNTTYLFPPSSYCASVNIYPVTEGILERLELPLTDESLVEYGVSAKPGALVELPPKVFCLLAWMVARGTTLEETLTSISRLTRNFVQKISVAQ